MERYLRNHIANSLAHALRNAHRTWTCRGCGCTDADCRGCIERTGAPCHWAAADLCSACDATTNVGAGFKPALSPAPRRAGVTP